MSSTPPMHWWSFPAMTPESPEFLDVCDDLPNYEQAAVLGYVAMLVSYSCRFGRRGFKNLNTLARVTDVPLEVLEAFTTRRYFIEMRKGGEGGAHPVVKVPQGHQHVVEMNATGQIITDENATGTVPNGAATVSNDAGSPGTTSGQDKKVIDQSRVEQMSSKKSSSERDEQESPSSATTTSSPPRGSSPSRPRHDGDSTFVPDDGVGVVSDDERRKWVRRIQQGRGAVERFRPAPHATDRADITLDGQNVHHRTGPSETPPDTEPNGLADGQRSRSRLAPDLGDPELIDAQERVNRQRAAAGATA